MDDCSWPTSSPATIRMSRRASPPTSLRPAAIVVLVAGMVAAWLAAGSTGLLGHPLQHALTWLALAVALVAGWPRDNQSFGDLGNPGGQRGLEPASQRFVSACRQRIGRGGPVGGRGPNGSRPRTGARRSDRGPGGRRWDCFASRATRFPWFGWPPPPLRPGDWWPGC